MTAAKSIAAALLASAALLCALAVPADAATGPAWELTSTSNTTAQPGEPFQFFLELRNVGDANSVTTAPGNDGLPGTEDDEVVDPIFVEATLPDGLEAIEASGDGFDCSTPDSVTIVCRREFPIETKLFQSPLLTFTAQVAADGLGPRTADFTVHGGGAPAIATVDPLTISPEPPAFGIDAFDSQLNEGDGSAAVHAGGHPGSSLVSFDLDTLTDPSPLVGALRSPEPLRDAYVDLPAGFVGNPTAAATCALVDLANTAISDPQPLCSPESQVGVATVRFQGQTGHNLAGPYPLYNLTAPPNRPARLGFNVYGTVVVLDPQPRSDGDYGLTVASRRISEGLSLIGTTVEIWDVPADPVHRPLRACPGERNPWLGGKSCSSNSPQVPFLRNPTSCTGPENSAIHVDSWFNPGDLTAAELPDLADMSWKSATSVSHQPPGYPYAPDERGSQVGMTDCQKVPFHPSLSASPTTGSADSPAGLDLHIGVPQNCWEHREELCTADLRDAAIRFPQGMTLNPSAADGLATCTPAQSGLSTPVGQSDPIHFDTAPVTCPNQSKIGTVEIKSPLLERPLTGAVYLAQQSQNPFGSLLAMYLIAEGSGVVIKQAGLIESGPGGRLTTRFTEAPQLPFEDLHVELFGGPRATLRTPPTCGSFAVASTLSPWSGNAPATPAAAFEIDDCPRSGFDPHFNASSVNPLAATTSPFNVRVSREDGTQEITSLNVATPPGLSGYLADVTTCPDAVLARVSADLGTGAEEAHPSCPASSLVGHVIIGAGSGPTPFYTTSGRVYLAGPYKGAPFSLVAVTPAVAGPLDLGTVVVRNPVRVDPATAQLTVQSDPLPTSVHGIPLDLRDIRFNVDRDHFTLNPTNCDPMSVASTITSPSGATATPADRYQLGGCERLGFKPKLIFALKGAVHRRAYPSLTATLVARPGDANIARAQVKLPPAAFLANAHIGTVCTRVQFAAQQCPPDSVYGTVSATTPILASPLAGNVYLRSSDHKLPDLVADLRGPDTQPIEVALAGKTDSVKGALRNTFEVVPDVPVTRFQLKLFGGKKGLIEMSSGFCRHPRATVQLDAHNGRTYDTTPVVRSKCGGGKKKAKK